MLQGRRDFAFGIEQATIAMQLVRGRHFLYIGDFGHAPSTFPGPDSDYVRVLSGKWFDRFLSGFGPAFDFGVQLAPEDPARSRFAYAAYPALPPTRRPSFSLPGTSTIGRNGKASRVTARLHAALETFGSPVVRVPVRLSGGWSRVLAVLAAKTRAGRTIVVSDGGVNASGRSGRATLAIRLISQATLIPRGSRLRLTLASSSLAQDPSNLLYLNLPMPRAARISIGDARLTVPVLRHRISR